MLYRHHLFLPGAFSSHWQFYTPSEIHVRLKQIHSDLESLPSLEHPISPSASDEGGVPNAATMTMSMGCVSVSQQFSAAGIPSPFSKLDLESLLSIQSRVLPFALLICGDMGGGLFTVTG